MCGGHRELNIAPPHPLKISPGGAVLAQWGPRIFTFSISLAISLDSWGQSCQDLQWHPTHCHRQFPEWALMLRSHPVWGISYYSRKVLCWVWGMLLFIGDQNYLMKVSAVSVLFGNIKLVFPFCSRVIESRIRSLSYLLKFYSLPLFRFLKINRLDSAGFTWDNSWELEVMVTGI